MRKASNMKFTLILIIITISSIVFVDLFVRFNLSENDMGLFIIRFNSMLIAGIMVLILIIFIIIFFIRLLLKKENCFGRALAIISTITIIITVSTCIMIKEEGKYFHTININWKIDLPSKYDEIYYKDSGSSFLGDGERYAIFQYETLDEVKNVIEWKTKDNSIEGYITKILENLEVPKENYPNFNNDFIYYHKLKEDNSQMYIILNSELNRIYIVEHIQ